MTKVVNTHQAEAWNGYEGEHWAAHYERYDAVNGGFNEVLLDAAGIGERDRVLDVGCGNGQVTRLAARRARAGKVVGVDLSGPMLWRARERAEAEGVSNVIFEQGDAQVHPFPAGGFDVVMSRVGIMFFQDPVAAFSNLRRALRPGGRLAFLAMQELDGTDLGAVFGSMAEYMPRPTGPSGKGPTSFGDPARIREVLGGAGFQDVTWTHVEADQVWGRDVEDAAEFIWGWGPVKYHMDQVDDVSRERARAALTESLRPFEQPDAVRLRGTSWLVRGVR